MPANFAPQTTPYPSYPMPPVDVTAPTPPNAINDQMAPIVNSAIPGYSGLSKSASSIVGNMLGGLPSAAPAQRSAAYFGTQTGMPNSDFARNRGYDLYGQESEQFKQRGFDDFLKLLNGTIGTVTTTPGQQIQQDQFNRTLNLQQQEANQNAAGHNADYNLRSRQTRLPDSYTEFDALGNKPLFGKGSGRIS